MVGRTLGKVAKNKVSVSKDVNNEGLPRSVGTLPVEYLNALRYETTLIKKIEKTCRQNIFFKKITNYFFPRLGDSPDIFFLC